MWWVTDVVCAVALCAIALALLCASALWRVSHRAPTPPVAEPANPVAQDPPGQAPPNLPPEALGQAGGDPREPVATATVSPAPTFFFDAFCRELMGARDVASKLAATVRDIREREADVSSTPPLPVELFLARQLEEADLNALEQSSEEGQLPIGAVMLSRTDRIYLRTPNHPLPWRSALAVIRVEAALNMLCDAQAYFDDLAAVDQESLYRLVSRVRSSVCAQAGNVDTADWTYLAMPWQARGGPAESGEWSLRWNLAEAIESALLPYRLQARFRCNVAGGDAALEFSMTPAQAFPRSAFAGELGIVATSAEMRRRAASEYAARVALLLASQTFNASRRVRRVWVAAVLETPTAHACYLSACIERRQMAHLDLSSVRDPLETLRRMGAAIDVEAGVLVPCAQCFYLEDERFCPPLRHDLWQMSERNLPASAALSLGCTHVSGLSIYEELPRVLAAERIMASISDPQATGSTQRSVRAILDVANTTSDLTVWDAAERLVRRLVDGTLSAEDPEAMRLELVEGGGLSACVDRAQRLVAKGRPHDAVETLRAAVRPLESAGSYTDTDAVVYRCFEGFAERVVYNRLNARDHRSVILVPDAYLMAELMLSALLLALPADDGGNAQAALAHARHALMVAPLNTSANIGVAACLEATGDHEAAARQIRSYLDAAYHPQGIAFAYFRLASIMQAMGKSDARNACYQLCLRTLPQMMPYILMEMGELADGSDESIGPVEPATLMRAMESAQIPLAPSPHIAYILYDGACASVDSEVFPVARDLMRVIEALTGDDVIRAVRQSLECEPDV